jgi:hypothetical protein
MIVKYMALYVPYFALVKPKEILQVLQRKKDEDKATICKRHNSFKMY